MVVKGRVSTQRGENALMETHMGVARGISTVGRQGGRVVFMIVPTLRVVMPPWVLCACSVTQSVKGHVPTRSVGTISEYESAALALL